MIRLKELDVCKEKNLRSILKLHNILILMVMGDVYNINGSTFIEYLC